MTPGDSSGLQSRIAALVAIAVIVCAGMAVRAWTGGGFAKYAGVALYGAMIYAVVIGVRPRLAVVRAGAIALAVCWAIELAQLTGVPAALSAHSRLARLALGTTFHAPDLFWYAAGIAPILGLHWLVRRRSSIRPRNEITPRAHTPQ